MTNIAVLYGRLTEEPRLSLKKTGSDTRRWCSFCLAVEKDRKSDDGYNADFLRCIVFGKPASYLTTYGKKGGRVLVTGKLRPVKLSGSPEEENTYTQVVADRLYVIDGRGDRIYGPGHPPLDAAVVSEMAGPGNGPACRASD